MQLQNFPNELKKTVEPQLRWRSHAILRTVCNFYQQIYNVALCTIPYPIKLSVCKSF